jgi:hypothetical protein
MKRLLFILIVLSCLIAPALADGNVTNSTNVTYPDPVILSFMGGHMFGENPIEILDNQTGRIAFIGNTSSKGVNLTPDRGYIIRVEPAGISDAANAPDAGLVGAMKWAEKNPLGTFVFSSILAVVLIRLKRK